jgi:hypothetical protein
MRMLTAISLLLFLALASGCAASDTNEFTLFKHQARRAAYEWRISEARAAATPEWRIGTTNIPVSPDKAWQIALDSFAKRGEGGGDLLRMQILPFNLSGESKTLRKKFYYRIEYVPGAFDSMFVVVLMDGTVLEPQRIPNLPPEEIK